MVSKRISLLFLESQLSGLVTFWAPVEPTGQAKNRNKYRVRGEGEGCNPKQQVNRGRLEDPERRQSSPLDQPG